MNAASGAAGSAESGGTVPGSEPPDPLPLAPLKPNRFWRWLNLGTLAATLLSVLFLQWMLRRDCLRVQTQYGYQGCLRDEAVRPQLNWSEGFRRELLFASVRDRSWLWPLATNDDVRRGAAQQLVETARAFDTYPVRDAVADGTLDPCFGALHFVLASSEWSPFVPRFLTEWLDGEPHQQLFAVVALAMLTGTRAEQLTKHDYDPLPPTGDAATLATARDEICAKLFGVPLANIVAHWRASAGSATQRPRGEIVLLLATCPRSWTAEWF